MLLLAPPIGAPAVNQSVCVHVHVDVRMSVGQCEYVYSKVQVCFVCARCWSVRNFVLGADSDSQTRFGNREVELRLSMVDCCGD